MVGMWPVKKLMKTIAVDIEVVMNYKVEISDANLQIQNPQFSNISYHMIVYHATDPLCNILYSITPSVGIIPRPWCIVCHLSVQ